MSSSHSPETNIAILPNNDPRYSDTFLLAPPASEHSILNERLRSSLENDLGLTCQEIVPVSLRFVDRSGVLDPGLLDPKDGSLSPEDAGVETLAGRIALRIGSGESSIVNPGIARDMATLVAREYEDDTERNVVNYATEDKKASPIRITGLNYNLAKEITDEHEILDLDAIVREQARQRREKANRKLGALASTKLAFASVMGRLSLPSMAS